MSYYETSPGKSGPVDRREGCALWEIAEEVS